MLRSSQYTLLPLFHSAEKGILDNHKLPDLETPSGLTGMEGELRWGYSSTVTEKTSPSLN